MLPTFRDALALQAAADTPAARAIPILEKLVALRSAQAEPALIAKARATAQAAAGAWKPCDGCPDPARGGLCRARSRCQAESRPAASALARDAQRKAVAAASQRHRGR